MELSGQDTEEMKACDSRDEMFWPNLHKNIKNTEHNFPFLFFCQSFMGEDGKAGVVQRE